MCGRFILRAPADALAKAFGVAPGFPIPPRYNIAPTQAAVAVRRLPGRPERECAALRWGLIPSWAKDADIGARMINARAETVATKPAFRAAFRRRRCLVPADGFYEWQKAGGRRQPYYVGMADGRVFAFAGLWERWRASEGQMIESFAIVVTDANAALREIHDRMPVIIHPEDYAFWLDPGVQMIEALETLLRPYPADGMVAYPVSRQVNSPRNDGPALIARLA